MPKIYLNILNNERLKLFKQFGFVNELKMYLAGGTALALQIGHRTSVDFDFYTLKKIKKGELKQIFKADLKDYKLKVVRDIDNTFEISINNIYLSCFYYPYELIKKEIIAEGVKMASIEDIAAMKIVAISQRGKKRDFIDIYYLIKLFGLSRILTLTKKKYSEFDIYNGLRGLLYFQDADNDSEISRIKIFDKNLKWRNVKEFIKKEVFDFQKKAIKKV
ncbi:nucleotidyl transferase AbiEii/AbiGii toxin family protein [Candidatus Parcubacteria bacterium]|nr:nucleotidyl transferase AbiEii/AbiGii toxin family protein [Candidatus Parcubacteria bacterium]